MATTTYTKTGNKSTSKVTLDKSVFGLEVNNTQLLKQSYVSAKANARNNLAHTKTRGEVRGGGRKPWRQKGTGRARFGSIRNPIWRGGGIVFGPLTKDNYTKQLSSGSKRLALKQALSLADGSQRIAVIESFPSTKKTAELSKVLSKIDFSKGLLITNGPNEDVKISARNLPGVSVIEVAKLSAVDVLDSETVLFEKDALTSLGERLKA